MHKDTKALPAMDRYSYVIEKLNLVPFDDHDWDGWGGAESWEDHPPIRVYSENSVLIVDASGIYFEADGDEENDLSWTVETNNAHETFRYLATMYATFESVFKK
jgi:hypothetical protein